MEFIEMLKSSNLVWLILSLCSIISVPLAIYFGIKSIARKIIITVFTSELVINKTHNISKITILFDNEVVDNISATRLSFWNHTYPTIQKADIINNYPLTIFSKNGKILDVCVLHGEDTSNMIEVSHTSDTTANITFNYLDKGEGGIIQVIHTGDSNSIDITRKIKGGKVIVKKTPIGRHTILLFSYIIFFMLLCCIFLFSHNSKGYLISYFFLLLSTVPLGKNSYTHFCLAYTPKNCRK